MENISRSLLLFPVAAEHPSPPKIKTAQANGLTYHSLPPQLKIPTAEYIHRSETARIYSQGFRLRREDGLQGVAYFKLFHHRTKSSRHISKSPSHLTATQEATHPKHLTLLVNSSASFSKSLSFNSPSLGWAKTMPQAMTGVISPSRLSF